MEKKEQEEEFSGLGTTLYSWEPGHLTDGIHELKLQHASEVINVGGVEATNTWTDSDGLHISYDVTSDTLSSFKELFQLAKQQKQSLKGMAKIYDEAGILMKSWLDGGRCIARYNRLRRHYNRWRRSYATRKTYYAPKFDKFLRGFMFIYKAHRYYYGSKMEME